MGSLLASYEETIREASRARKAFGGGMRQAGVIAAASLYAFEHHVERLVEDHERARKLAEGLAEAGYTVEMPEINIVLVEVGNAEKFLAELAEKGVLATLCTASTIRFVTHHDVPNDMQKVADACVQASAEVEAQRTVEERRR